MSVDAFHGDGNVGLGGSAALGHVRHVTGSPLLRPSQRYTATFLFTITVQQKEGIDTSHLIPVGNSSSKFQLPSRRSSICHFVLKNVR